MKGIIKDKLIVVRVSEPELKKYKQASESVGLSVSGFVRYSSNKAMRLIKSNKDEVL